jgi:secreted PhoX family phosphatase
MHRRQLLASAGMLGCIAVFAGFAAAQSGSVSAGPFPFTPLPASAQCIPGGAGTFPDEQPFLLPEGYEQKIVARQGDGGTTDNWDMHVLNENGPHAGEFLYHSHETPEDGMISVTDLQTGETRVLAQRAYWNRLDGLAWTPWGTLLTGEEMRPARTPSTPDPRVPQAQAGLMYELDPVTGVDVVLPALGARSHEGMRIDPQGNVYGISETAPATAGRPPGGYIFRFVPDRRGDLTSGQLYALKIVVPTGDRTGEAVWIPLDRDAVQVDADVTATAAGATGYGRPEDVEMATSTGSNRGGANILYVAVTDEDRVLRVDLRDAAGAATHATAFVSEYVRKGVNAPAEFTNPDNLALDKNGNLFITEDTPTVFGGMDIWVAVPSAGDPDAAEQTVRFASLTDCTAEPSGIYFDRTGSVLFAHALHRGGATSQPPLSDDLSVAITRVKQD